MELNCTSEDEFTWIKEGDKRNNDFKTIYSVEKISK